MNYLIAKEGNINAFFIPNPDSSSIPLQYLAEEKAVAETSFLRKGNHSLFSLPNYLHKFHHVLILG